MTAAKLICGIELALQHIDSGARKQRNIEIMKRYYGFDGNGGTSMEEAGSQHSLTRESVRQITNRIASAFPSALPLVPEIREAVKLIKAIMPCAAEDAQIKLSGEGLIPESFMIEGVINAAKCFGLISSEIDIVKLNGVRFVVSEKHLDLPRIIHSKAIKGISHNGAVSITALSKQIDVGTVRSRLQFVNRIVESMEGVTWVDDHEWFYFDGRGRNRLISRLNKIFSVLNDVPVASLRKGIERSWSKNMKKETELLPCGKLIELIETLEGFTVTASGIISRENASQHDEEAKPFELAIAEFINCASNKIAKEKEIEDSIVMTVQDKYNFSMALNYSPLFMKRERPAGAPEGQYFRGQYVLIGKMR
ncbi:hypothetical protein D3C87_378380 [compost metagenome]